MFSYIKNRKRIYPPMISLNFMIFVRKAIQPGMHNKIQCNMYAIRNPTTKLHKKWMK
jgi:hypothetical protein